jgi:ubiquinone/menaquinone biosynthesis C-methylase UbiE
MEAYNQNVQEYIVTSGTRPMTIELDAFCALVPPGGSVLDVGCGYGRDTLALAGKGFSPIGIDLSTGLLEEARRRAPEVDFRQMNMLELDFPDNTFDGIWACASLLHLSLEDIPKALAEFYRVLKPGGSVFITMKQGDDVEKNEPSFSSKIPRHFSFVSPHNFKNLLEQAGFTIKEFLSRDERTRFGAAGREGILWITTLVIK